MKPLTLKQAAVLCLMWMAGSFLAGKAHSATATGPAIRPLATELSRLLNAYRQSDLGTAQPLLPEIQSLTDRIRTAARLNQAELDRVTREERERYGRFGKFLDPDAGKFHDNFIQPLESNQSQLEHMESTITRLWKQALEEASAIDGSAHSPTGV